MALRPDHTPGDGVCRVVEEASVDAWGSGRWPGASAGCCPDSRAGRWSPGRGLPAGPGLSGGRPAGVVLCSAAAVAGCGSCGLPPSGPEGSGVREGAGPRLGVIPSCWRNHGLVERDCSRFGQAVSRGSAETWSLRDVPVLTPADGAYQGTGAHRPFIGRKFRLRSEGAGGRRRRPVAPLAVRCYRPVAIVWRGRSAELDTPSAGGETRPGRRVRVNIRAAEADGSSRVLPSRRRFTCCAQLARRGRP